MIAKKLCDDEMAKIIVRLHVMTGCDSVSSFFGIGKKSVWKNTKSSEEARALLLDFSDQSLIKFTIKYVYNDKESSTLAEMRAKKWDAMKKKSLARVGIDEDTCVLRNKRVRYQSYVFEHFYEACTSSPVLNGGYTRDGKYCMPIKYTKSAMPNCLENYAIPRSEVSNAENAYESDNGEEEDEHIEDIEDIDEVEI